MSDALKITSTTTPSTKQKKGSKVPPPPKPPGYSDVKQPIRIKASCFREAEKTGTVFHDFQPANDLVTHFAAVTIGDHEEMTSRPMAFDAWEMLIRKMIYLAIGKKLASSLPPKEALENTKVVMHMQKQELCLPAGLLPLIDLYGKIRADEAEYNLIGHSFLTLTYTLRAISTDTNTFMGAANVVNRSSDIFINAASVSTFNHAKEWLVGFVNAWAAIATPVQMDFGAGGVPAITVIHLPLLVSGAAGYRALIANVQVPAEVVTALRRLQFLEGIPNGAVWTLAQVNAAFALGIQVVDYGRDDFATRTAHYGLHVQTPLLSVLQRHYDMIFIKTCKDYGTMGQLIRRERVVFGHAPEKIPDADIDIGWMMSGGKNFARMEPERFMVQSESSVNEMFVTYLSSMRKI